MLAMGWRGSARHWHRYETAYLLLAGLATPLVVSVHTVVSFDFAVAIVPGWHTTIFPPYFVAGAIFSGFAMVMTLAIPMRYVYGLRRISSPCGTWTTWPRSCWRPGLIVAYGYAAEVFFSWYSGNTYEKYVTLNRMFGPYGWSYWMLIACNIIVPQVLWFRLDAAQHRVAVRDIDHINVGMWMERFVIVVTSLHRDYLPSSWGMYYPTRWDFIHYFGSLGLFFTLLFLFLRVLPMISIFELRDLVHETEGEG